ncbi:MAG: pitrilysin family protein [Thermomonas sp.]|uniref:M16 family metallopeptidase n=1 Tax=Thermomonas sp. TaxID=1971895 RepID=UPI0039E694A9
MKSLRLHVIALACLIALPGAAFAGNITLPKGTSAGACVEGICEYRLHNGLRVLLFPDASKPTVTVNLTYLVGSVHENYGETGMAHLLEHMLFKGTPTHPDIPGELKKRGASFNATTSLDRTNYFSSFPANDDTLDAILRLEADRMVNSNVAKKDLDSEMTVVRNEMERSENNPAGILGERMRSTAYLWHNYGKDTIGARSDVENVPIERLQAFYKTWYQPDNAVLIVAGRFDESALLGRIAAIFGAIKKPARTLPTMYTAEPVQDGEREVIVRRSGDVRVTRLAYHMPAATHPDAVALALLGDILSHSPGGRLHKALVQTRLAASASAYAGNSPDPGLFSLSMTVAKDADPAKAEAELLKQAEQIAATPITEAELAETKQRIANEYEKAFDNVNRVCMAMSEYVAAGDWRLWFVLRDAAEQVTVDDINRVARTYLIPSNRTLARFIPTENTKRAIIPQAPSLSSLVEGYKGREALQAGETFDPTPANIAARTEVFAIGDTLTVSLLPKKTRGSTVVFNASFRFADVEALRRFSPQAHSFAGSMLMRGSKTLTREQISKRFEALKTNASVLGGGQGANILLQTKRGELVEALTLAADILRNPAFPEAEFEQLRIHAITSLEAQRKEPGSVAGQALGKAFNPWPAGHPMRFRSIDEQLAGLKALKLDELRAWHRQMYGTSDGQIAIVGDFDPAQIKPLLETLFAGWKPGVPYARIATHYSDVPARHERLETPDKANAVFIARQNMALNDDDPDYPAMLVADEILGSNGLKSRLGDRVRQQDGLSYSIGSSLSADSSVDNRDDAGNLTVQAIVAPQNMDRLEAAVREELARFVKDGITATELKDAVSGMLTRRQQSRASDATVARMLNADAELQRPMLRRAVSDEKLRALTVEQVNAAIRRFIKPAQFSVFQAGDFAGAGKAAAAK